MRFIRGTKPNKGLLGETITEERECSCSRFQTETMEGDIVKVVQREKVNKNPGTEKGMT